MNEKNEVVVTKTPTSMINNEFHLILLASDGGDPQLTSMATVTFTLDPDVIDECDSAECANSAPCTSYLNDYFCDCTPGWKGLLCNIECTNNKHGQDCTQNCDCNATRIATNAQDQMCDPVNGDCRCNAFWSGTKCETDINECNAVGTCDTSEDLVCENSIGNFDCVCRTHYKDVRGTCEKCEYNMCPFFLKPFKLIYDLTRITLYTATHSSSLEVMQLLVGAMNDIKHSVRMCTLFNKN
ncbi:hypothetical protein ACF0H5_009231 [Mactra antiquata]